MIIFSYIVNIMVSRAYLDVNWLIETRVNFKLFFRHKSVILLPSDSRIVFFFHHPRENPHMNYLLFLTNKRVVWQIHFCLKSISLSLQGNYFENLSRGLVFDSLHGNKNDLCLREPFEINHTKEFTLSSHPSEGELEENENSRDQNLLNLPL